MRRPRLTHIVLTGMNIIRDYAVASGLDHDSYTIRRDAVRRAVDWIDAYNALPPEKKPKVNDDAKRLDDARQLTIQSILGKAGGGTSEQDARETGPDEAGPANPSAGLFGGEESEAEPVAGSDLEAVG